MGVEYFIAVTLAGLAIERVWTLVVNPLKNKRNGKYPTIVSLSTQVNEVKSQVGEVKDSLGALTTKMDTYCQLNDRDITTLRERVTKLE